MPPSRQRLPFPHLLSACLLGIALGAEEAAPSPAPAPAPAPLDQVEVRAGDELLAPPPVAVEPAGDVLAGERLRRFEDGRLGETLRRMPSLSFSGPPGLVKDVRVRGFDKGYTQVLVDGQLVMGGTPDRQLQVDRLSSFLVERIEVVHIPLANQPHDAVAGSVNIVMREIPEERIGAVRVGAHLHGGHIGPLAEVLVGDGRGAFGWLATAGYDRSHLDKHDLEYTSNANLVPKEWKVKNESSQYDQVQLAPRLRWRQDAWLVALEPTLSLYREDKWKVEEKWSYGTTSVSSGSGKNKVTVTAPAIGLTEIKLRESERKDVPIGQVMAKLEHRTARNRFTVTGGPGAGREEKELTPEYTSKIKLDGSFNGWDIKHTWNDQKRDRGWQARAEDEVVVGGQALLAGIDWSNRYRTEAKEEATYSYNSKGTWTGTKVSNGDFNGHERVLAAYAMATLRAGSHTLIPGVRVEQAWTAVEAGSQTALPNKPTRSSDSRDDAVVLPSLHYAWRSTEWLRLAGAGARLLKRPKFGDLSPLVSSGTGTYADPYVAGNTGLEAERAWGAEVSATLGQRGVHGAELRLSAFKRWLDGVIEKTTEYENGAWFSRTRNVGDGEVRGLEAAAYLQPSWAVPGLELWGSATRLRSNLQEESTGKERPMKEMPDYLLSTGVDQAFGRSGVTVGAAVTLKGPSTSIDGNKEEVERRYVQLDAYVRWQATSALSLALAGVNLNDVTKHKVATNPTTREQTDKVEMGGPTITCSGTLTW